MFRNRKGKVPRGHSGQSTVEYIVLATAVISVVIIFVTGNNSVFKTKLGNVLGNAAEDISDRGEKLSDTHEGSNPGKYVGPTDALQVDPTKNLFKL